MFLARREAVKELSDAEARRLLSAPPDGNLAAVMRVVLRRYRCGGWLTINVAAELGGMSVRSLQRQLAEEGLTFSELVDQVRAELAVELLKDSKLSLATISEELGYAAPANFARAFRRWTGMTPTEFRDNANANGGKVA